MKDNGEWRALSLEELLEITAAGPSYDEARVRAMMKIVAAAVEFCNEADRILLKQHKSAAAERRDGLMEFIACTWHFLKVMGAGRDQLDKVAEYHSVLGDIDRGVVGAMLEVNNRNPGVTSQIQLLRGMCAVAMDYLVEAGEPVDDAAKRVARIPGFEKLRSGRSIGIDRKTGKKPEPFKSVKKWRKNASRGKDLDKTFRMAWDFRQPPGSVTALEFGRLSARQIDKLRHALGTLQADL